MESIWTKPEIQALGEERIRLLKEAAEKSKGKSGIDRLDVFLDYGEQLAKGAPLSGAERQALLAVIAESMSESERKQMEQMIQLMGMMG